MMTSTMKRTQIYLDEELDEELRQAAVAEGRSAAAIIREAVHRYLAEQVPRADPDPILQLAGAFSGGPKDASTEHDRYLYGRSGEQAR
jgi:hypothetical protein